MNFNQQQKVTERDLNPQPQPCAQTTRAVDRCCHEIYKYYGACTINPTPLKGMAMMGVQRCETHPIRTGVGSGIRTHEDSAAVKYYNH